MTDLALVQACEERIVNAWPSVDTILMDGWAIRMANGYSGRANSASPLLPGACLTPDLLQEFERLFRQAGLSPCIRLTPLCDQTAVQLTECSRYRQRDASIGMVAPLENGGLPPACLDIAEQAEAAWIRGVSALQDGSKRDADAALAAIVTRVRMRAGFATLRVDGEPAGFGMSVVDRGMAEIGSLILDARYRGKGHGRTLVSGLMGWARRQGADRAFLQVEHTNTIAIGLYRSLGFDEAYRYRTMVKD